MNTHITITAIIFFPGRHIPTAQSVRTPTATEMESVAPMRVKNPTPLRPPTFFQQRLNRCKAETRRQFTGAHSPLAVRTKAWPHCNAVNHKSADPRLTKHLIFRDSVNKNNYDNSDYGFDLGWAGVLVNGPDCCGSTQVVSRDLWSQIWPCPALIWGDDDSISPKEVPVAAAKCVYSCTASNIHQMPSLQCVMWGNQHFTGCQMMSKAVATWQCQKENGSNTHIRYTGFFLV